MPEIISNRRAIVADLVQFMPLREIDVIDIAGTAQASLEFADLLAACAQNGGVRVRVLLLDPAGSAASIRARESDFWNGDDTGMRQKIARNAASLRDRSRDLISIEVRFYDEVPVSRYVRADAVVYQSYYPSASSGKNVPVVRMDSSELLAQRAMREFDVLWGTRARA